MVKVTFTLDDTTVSRLRQAALRLNQPQSAVVRDAVQDYAQRIGRLSEQERLKLLRVLDEIIARPARRTARQVDAELNAIRRARRHGGRRHSTA